MRDLLNNLEYDTRIAPSFDCNKAANFAEISICQSNNLSGKDKALGGTYRTALSRSEDKPALRALSNEWRINTSKCRDSDCISSAYDNIIVELTAD